MIFLSIPIDYLMKKYAVFKAKRIFPVVDMTVIIDILVFVSVVISFDYLLTLGEVTPILITEVNKSELGEWTF